MKDILLLYLCINWKLVPCLQADRVNYKFLKFDVWSWMFERSECGGMAEWLMAAVLKTAICVSISGVQILLPPPARRAGKSNIKYQTSNFWSLMFEVGNSCIASVEEYPSGSRGRFAKPLVAAMPARVQISPPPFSYAPISSEFRWRLIWYSYFVDRDKALAFEKYLKSGSGYAFARKRFI